MGIPWPRTCSDGDADLCTSVGVWYQLLSLFTEALLALLPSAGADRGT